MNTGKKIMAGVLILAAAGAYLACQDAPDALGQYTTTTTTTVVTQTPVQPPPPRAEVIRPEPSPQHVWIPGSWKRKPDKWMWVGGRWEQPPYDGALSFWRWLPGHWAATA